MIDKIQSSGITSNVTDSGENPPMISAAADIEAHHLYSYSRKVDP